jgi:hypothetical protein
VRDEAWCLWDTIVSVCLWDTIVSVCLWDTIVSVCLWDEIVSACLWDEIVSACGHNGARVLVGCDGACGLDLQNSMLRCLVGSCWLEHHR